MIRTIWPLLFTLFTGGVDAADPVPITFPSDSGIVDVRSFGAVPDDESDDTEAIQSALDEHPNGNRIIFLAPGVYLLRDTLRWPGTTPVNSQKRTILQGSGESLTILRVPPGTKGFNDSNKPKAVIWTGDKPAQRIRNSLRNLTIEIGENNRGAAGLRFNASNQGCLKNITIRAARDSGWTGLDLAHTDEIGPLFVQNLTVEGFEYGIQTKWPVNSLTFEHVRLLEPRRIGWWNYHQMIFVRGLIAETWCPVLYNEKYSWGAVVLLDSHLHALAQNHNQTAIKNERQLFLAGVDVVDYRKPVENSDRDRDRGDITQPGVIDLDTSHRNVRSLFREIKDGTFATAGEVSRLPVKETPVVPWGNPGKDWANLVTFGGDPTGATDSSTALQQAIDSGASTVYLPGDANFHFSRPVSVRGPVRRIIGLEGRLTSEGEALWKIVDNAHPSGLKDAPVVVIERMENRGSDGLPIRHESSRTLVLSSTMGFRVEGRSKGDVFLEDFHGHLDRIGPGQSVWCRQLSIDSKGEIKCHNVGGKLWVLGLKGSNRGTLVETTSGGHTEINGAFLYSNAGWDETVPAFICRDSTMNLFGINERNFNRDRVSFWVSETQGEETKELRERPWVFLSKEPLSEEKQEAANP